MMMMMSVCVGSKRKGRDKKKPQRVVNCLGFDETSFSFLSRQKKRDEKKTLPNEEEKKKKTK